MSFTEAKPIPDLYTDVAEYDLVVVPDGPLSRALNRRVDRPQLGKFAVTPRELAAGQIDHSEHRTAFLEIINETDLDWREAAYTIDTILGCWEYEGHADAILDYDSYVDRTTNTVLETLQSVDITSHRLTDYQIDAQTNVAVVAPDLYTPLEASIFPTEYDTYSVFTDSTFELPPFHVFDSATGIVEAVVDSITDATAENVAILLDGDSQYSALVESALEAADIPFYGGPGFVDQATHRTFLQLLRASYRGPNVQIQTLRPLFDQFDITLDISHDEKRLHEVNTTAATQLSELLSELRTCSFAGALTQFEDRCGIDCPAFHTELTRLGLADTPVTPATIEQLTFYLQTHDVPIDRDNEGVLLADISGATFVDRPTVFCLGIDEDWTKTPPNRPWVSETELYERYIKQFQLSLQNGVEQHYLVEDTRGGEPVTPCLYFDELLDSNIDRFTDFDHLQHHHSPTNLGDGFDRMPTDIEPSTVETISQSSLNTYTNSPRDYLFSQLLEGPDKDYFTEGNLFHDFAELYVNHPDRIDSGVMDEVVDMMTAETNGFHRQETIPIHRTEYRFGLETIAAYLEANPPAANSLTLTNSSGGYDNELANRFGWELTETIAEHRFQSIDQGITGTIDLIHQPDTILDYKSSSRQTAGSVVSNAAVDPPADEPDFQAILYLEYFRQLNPQTELEFTFVHFLEAVTDALDGSLDLSDTETTLTYYPKSFDSFAHSESTFEYLRDEGSNKCQKTLSKTSYEVYDEVFETHSIPETRDSDVFIASPLGEAMEAALKTAVGDYKYVTKGTKQLFRELARIRRRNLFKNDMNAFETFIQERLAELNARRAGEERFPIAGPAGEPAYRRVNNRDLLIDDD